MAAAFGVPGTPAFGDPSQGDDFAGGPGSGPQSTKELYGYQSIFDKPKPVLRPAPGPPPQFEIDEQGNLSRTKGS